MGPKRNGWVDFPPDRSDPTNFRVADPVHDHQNTKRCRAPQLQDRMAPGQEGERPRVKWEGGDWKDPRGTCSRVTLFNE